jgi:ribonuclease BN (tRNA processing enzyme)
MGIINLKDEVVDLFLEKFNDRVALGDHRITLIDLVFPVKNSLLPCGNDSLLFYHQGLKLLYLGDLSVSIPEVTLRDTDQLTHTAT